jgi:hypothetical protein
MRGNVSEGEWELLVRPRGVLRKLCRQRTGANAESWVPATAVLPGVTITGRLYLPSELFMLEPARCLSCQVADLVVAIAIPRRRLQHVADTQATLSGAATTLQALIVGTVAATHRN